MFVDLVFTLFVLEAVCFDGCLLFCNSVDSSLYWLSLCVFVFVYFA